MGGVGSLAGAEIDVGIAELEGGSGLRGSLG
jgi:hypothetical protein